MLKCSTELRGLKSLTVILFFVITMSDICYITYTHDPLSI